MRRRYVQIDGILVEYGDHIPERVAPDVRGDIEPYQSMATGEMITSRSKHREHLKANGLIEIGNETKHLLKDSRNFDVNPQGRRELIRAQVDAMRHQDFRTAIKRDIDRIKWESRKE